MRICNILLAVILNTCLCLGGDPNIAFTIYKEMFENYTSKVRPLSDDFQSVDVQLSFVLNQIQELDEVNQVLNTVGYFVAYWKDEFLSWDPAMYGGIEHIVVPAQEIWRPELVIVNGAESFYDSSFSSDFRVDIHYSGNISWAFGGIIATSCNLDLTYYPFDKQRCTIGIENWAYTKADVDLIASSDTILFDDYQPNGIWTCDHTSVQKSVFYQKIHSNMSYPRITFSILLTRKYQYYINSIMAPCVLLLAIALAMFLLPPDSGEKIGLGITIVLAFSVFQVVINDNIPANSDSTPVLASYVLFIMILCSLSTIISILVLRLHHHGSRSKVPVLVQAIFFRFVAKVLCMKKLVPVNAKNEVESCQSGDRLSDTQICCSRKSVNSIGDIATEDKLLKKMSDVEDHLKFFRRYLEEQDAAKQTEDEWKALAAVVDRLFFWLMLIVCIIGFPVFLTDKDQSH